MGVIEYSILGGANLTRDGRAIELDTRKGIALLAYLLLTKRTHQRDALAAFFWPEADQVSARGALRRTLSSLRKAIGEDLLETNRETVKLVVDDRFYCDASHFRQLLERVRDHRHPQGDLCQPCVVDLVLANQLYQGDFMKGFSLRDSLAFDDWQFQQAEQFRRELSEVLVNLVEAFSGKMEYVKALEYARRWLSLDLLNEMAHRTIMYLLAMSGQREAALRQYRECVRILENEIGVPPLTETTQLYDEIKYDRLSSARLSPRNVEIQKSPNLQNDQLNEVLPKERLLEFPMVGRDVEFQALMDIYLNPPKDGYLITLTGEAGIGKSRLAEEFIRKITPRGGEILMARCYQGEQSLSLMPVSGLIRQALLNSRQRGWRESVPSFALSETARLVPEMTELYPDVKEFPATDEPGAQSRFYEGLVQVLSALVLPAEEEKPSQISQPGLIFVDDMHWCDSASLEFLNFFLQRIHGKKIIVLVTWQEIDTEVTSQLQAITARLFREGRASSFTLGRLTQSQVENLMNLVEPAEGAIQAVWKAWIMQEAEGNPFFLTAYLQHLLQSSEKDVQRSEIPETILKMIQTRLASISLGSKQILQAAAAIGRSFDFLTLHEASGRVEEETISALEELIGNGLVREIKNELGHSLWYDFTHEKIRLTVYEEISLARRRLLHRRIAESLERQQHGRSMLHVGQIAGLIAIQYQQAGEMEKAAAYHQLAGENARNVFANQEALSHFSTALALGHPQRARLYLEIGDIHMLNGDYITAIQDYEAAAAQENEANRSWEISALVEWKIGLVYDRLGEWDLAQAQFSIAADKLPPLAMKQRSRLLSDWSLACHHRGDTQMAEELAGKALVLAQQAGDLQALAQIHNLLGVLALNRDDLAEAKMHLEQSLHLTEQVDYPSIQVAALNNLARLQQGAGAYQEAIGLVRKALDLCKTIGDRHHEAALCNHLADLYQATGCADQALELLKLAVTIFAEIGEEGGQWRPEVWKLTEW
jgi:DNA-binding SARP family transcriptional activator